MIVSGVTSQLTFGIHINMTKTRYGKHEVGKYKDKIINIYTDERDGTKLYDIYSIFGKWLGAKYVYFQKGIKNIVNCPP